MFTLLTRLFRPDPDPAPPPPRPSLPAVEAGDDPQQSCGWFDSSHELLQGVTVWEGIVVVDNTVAKHR
jgi:hypothetical protein